MTVILVFEQLLKSTVTVVGFTLCLNTTTRKHTIRLNFHFEFLIGESGIIIFQTSVMQIQQYQKLTPLLVILSMFCHGKRISTQIKSLFYKRF